MAPAPMTSKHLYPSVRPSYARTSQWNANWVFHNSATPHRFLNRALLVSGPGADNKCDLLIGRSSLTALISALFWQPLWNTEGTGLVVAAAAEVPGLPGLGDAFGRPKRQ